MPTLKNGFGLPTFAKGSIPLKTNPEGPLDAGKKPWPYKAPSPSRSLTAYQRQWSKLLGNMLGSKATTKQKLSRNQYDENKVYSGIRTMVLCLPNRTLVLLTLRRDLTGASYNSDYVRQRVGRAHHDPMVKPPSVNRKKVDL
jgi:hypothetical protein